MPIYEYRCTDCDTHIEKMQKVRDAPLEICEKCGGRLEKKWSLSGIQFKGAGWYVTDYSNKGKPEAKPAAKGEATSGGGGGGDAATAPPAAGTTASEKSSGGESTAAPSAASNSAKNDASASKKE